MTEARLSAANENISCTAPRIDDQPTLAITAPMDDKDCRRRVESLVKCSVVATSENDDEDMKIIIFEDFVNNIAAAKRTSVDENSSMCYKHRRN